MKKIIIIIFLSFFIFSNVSANIKKCDWVAYFSVNEHYYNNDWNFCEEWETVGNFMALNKNLSLDDIWDGTEYTFLANTYKREKDFTKSRVVLNWKTLLELKYKTENVFSFSNYSLSWRYVFTWFWHESWIFINSEDKEIFWVYINSEKIFENGLWNNWKENIYKEYWFLVDFKGWYNNLFLDYKKLKLVNYISEKIKKIEKTEKERYKNILKNELKKYVDEQRNYLKDNLKFEERRRAYILNYLLQEIIIDELLKERK